MQHEHLTGGATAPRIAVFSDFDGTLVEIADTPDAVTVPDSLRGRLDRTIAALDHAFAVITGRQIADVDRYLAPLELPVAGAHGAQRRRADGSMVALAPESIATAKAIAEALAPFATAHDGLLLEAKDGAVALHYRQAPDLAAMCRSAIDKAVADHPDFHVTEGKMVYEARPTTVDKGEALRAFMREAPFAGRVPIFIGDDVTDEDAFRVAQELGGLGIKIGEGETAARLRVADIAAAHELLSGLARLATEGRLTPAGPANTTN